VDAIPKEARLTHGAVYSHFGSKGAVAAEAIRLAMQGSRHLWQRLVERKGAEKAFPAIVATYLSREHCEMPGQGCVVATLGGEIARQPLSVRNVFTEELKAGLACLAALMPEDTPARRSDDAIAAFAGMVGALMLARAVNDATLAQRILRATAERITRQPKVRTPTRRTKRTR
jgi:TetR/AcrR family transcriptional repressor of nem operon